MILNINCIIFLETTLVGALNVWVGSKIPGISKTVLKFEMEIDQNKKFIAIRKSSSILSNELWLFLQEFFVSNFLILEFS